MSIPREGSRDIGDHYILVSTYPDVCLTPNGASMVPVPYTIWAKQSDDANTTPTVRMTRLRTHNMGSLITTCYGDEAGTGGGVKSGTHNGICEPREHSASVRTEGKYAVRHNDIWWMNNKNTEGRVYYVKEPDTQELTPHSQQDWKAKAAQPANLDAHRRVFDMGDPAAEMSKPGAQTAFSGGFSGQAPVQAPAPPIQAPPPPPQMVAPGETPQAPNVTTPSGPNVISTDEPGPYLSAPGTTVAGPSFFRDYAPSNNPFYGPAYYTDLPAPLNYVEPQYGGWFRLSDGQMLTKPQLEKKYDEALKKKRETQLAAPPAGRNNANVQVSQAQDEEKCPYVTICFSSAKIQNLGEFDRQLNDQAAGLQKLSPSEYLANRSAVTAAGSTDPSRNTAAAKTAYQNMWSDYLRKGGTNPQNGVSMAALHELDIVAGGYGYKFLRIGPSAENSLIGSLWSQGRGVKGGKRLKKLDDHAKKLQENGCPKMNAYLRRCTDDENENEKTS